MENINEENLEDMEFKDALKYSVYRLVEISKLLKKYEQTDNMVYDILFMANGLKEVVDNIPDDHTCIQPNNTVSGNQAIDILAQIKGVEI